MNQLDDGTVAWRALLAEAEDRLRGAGIGAAAAEARWLVEEASGMDGADLVLGLDEPATVRGVDRLDAMVGRRVAGEPIQYVLGHWAFRALDLMVDRRVLIPRPETEQVVEVALGELDRLAADGAGGTVVDLGTGSGAIALSIAGERPGTDVWGTDRSAEALEVARANLAALGMAGGRVRLVQGSWFEALPAELQGHVDLVVSNPPYIAADERLGAPVRDWEPEAALIAGPSGLEACEAILAGAARWLRPGGVVVLEIGSSQARAASGLAEAYGLAEVRVEPDLAFLDRALVARRPAA